jgi:hypothetical protein
LASAEWVPVFLARAEWVPILTPAFTAAGAAGELATIAFLVVFRVLIKDFFSMDMVRSSFTSDLTSTSRVCVKHEPCQTRMADHTNRQVQEARSLISHAGGFSARFRDSENLPAVNY